MDGEALKKMRELVQKVKLVYLATVGAGGIPHIAASEGLVFVGEDQITFREWFCLKTVENLGQNPNLSLAVLNPKSKEGYQIMGRLERIEKGAILDGYSPEEETRRAGYPQAEHRLSIRVKEISALTCGPHSDEFIRLNSELK